MYHPLIDFQLGGPLFLFALVIANAGWNATPRMFQAPPPGIQGVLGYIYNCKGQDRVGRKQYARLACKIVARLFVLGDVCAPAGVYPDIRIPKGSDGWPSWLRCLVSLSPVQALGMLAANCNLVPDRVYSTVERHYNEGLEAAEKVFSCLASLKLEPGTLARRINVLKDNIAVGGVSPIPRSLEARGYFYQVAAGDRAGREGGHKVCCTHVAMFGSVVPGGSCCSAHRNVVVLYAAFGTLVHGPLQRSTGAA
jgi:hypothetical protein